MIFEGPLQLLYFILLHGYVSSDTVICTELLELLLNKCLGVQLFCKVAEAPASRTRPKGSESLLRTTS